VKQELNVQIDGAYGRDQVTTYDLATRTRLT